MNQSSRLRPLLLLAVLALPLVACGGGGGGGGRAIQGASSSDEEAAGRAATEAIEVFLGILTGASSGQDLINIFAPECREGVKASDINGVLALIRVFAPQLADAKIDDLDLGKLSFNKTSEGIEVNVTDPEAVQVKANGKWVKATDYFESLGLDESDTSISEDVPTLMVKRDGKWYIGDCAELQDVSGGFGSGPSSTPSRSATSRPGASPTPSGPGSSRTTPIRLGQSGRVENLWEITVTAVDRDAWPKVQAASRFNDPPAANEKMLLMTVRARNISTNQKPENLDAYSFKLVGSRNQLYDLYSPKTDCGTIPNDLDADLFPNGQTEGNVCFKVPSDETGFVLIWEEFFGDKLTYFALE